MVLRMLTKTRYSLIIVVITLAMIAIGLIGWWRQLRQGIERDIAANRTLLRKSSLIEARSVPLSAITSAGYKIYQRRRAVRDLVRFGPSFFAATEGGLLEYDQAGQLKQHYTSRQGLPENDITALASYQGQLILGSRHGKLVSFDGDTFRQFQLTDVDLRHVSSLSDWHDQLAINSSAGLILFDGERFTTLPDLKMSDSGGVLMSGTSAGADYVGTFAAGFWLKREGRWQSVTSRQGLLSDRVLNIAARADEFLIGTDLGIVRIDAMSQGRDEISAKLVAPLADLADLIDFQERLYACRSNGDVFRLEATGRPDERVSLLPLERRWPATDHCRFRVIGANLFLLTDNGIWLKNAAKETQEFSRFDRELRPSLSDNMISALAFDNEGRLWVGLFSHGIDILSVNGELRQHLASETIREINHLRWDGEHNRMLAATSAGLLEFDPHLQVRTIVSNEDRLAGNIVSHNISQVNLLPASMFSPYRNDPGEGDRPTSSLLALATARGFSVGPEGSFQNFTTLQGLPSNSVYCSAVSGGKLFIGTLGGLAVLDGGRIIRSYTQSNSTLSANWVTALYSYHDDIFIGTYGGGLDRLKPSGELMHLRRRGGKWVVNLNAVCADDQYLYLGSLSDGCLIFDLKRGLWRQLERGLPSPNVMAISVNETYLFLGTEQGLVRIERGALAALTERKTP
jgi:ligand-binding sensor domain-containing protein